MARKKNLKYRDLPWNLRRRIDASGPMMQPRKSENPTVKNILDRLKDSEERAMIAEAPETARKKRVVIDLIESYLKKHKKSPEPPVTL